MAPIDGGDHGVTVGNVADGPVELDRDPITLRSAASDDPVDVPSGEAAESGPRDRSSESTGAALALLVATDVLGRYDETVTALAADPVTAADPGSGVRRMWDRTVTPGSLLHDDVLERMVTAPLADGTRLLPGPDGFGYRHHVTAITASTGDSITFSWCGYSPGIRVDRGSGAVIDDGVATMEGIGRMSRRTTAPSRVQPSAHHDPDDDRSDDRWASPSTGTVGDATSDGAAGPQDHWTLDELDHLDFDISPPGTTDPCIP